MPNNYQCVKCDSRSYETSQMQAAGGMFSKLFDVQSQKFTAITCSNCGYTEFYKKDSGTLSNIFDFLTD